ncbi:MAG: hypothetical protein K2K92_00845 [Duncaniella sp.]|nr:hypothetical protein [Duncaniella sp.]
MKNLIRYIALAAVGTFTAACQHDLDTYEGENGMYFSTTYDGAETLSDTIDVSWGMKNSSITSQEIHLTVKLFGHVSTVDRAFEIVVEKAPTYVPNKPKDDDDDDGSVVTTPSTPSVTLPGTTPEVTPTVDAIEGVDYVVASTRFVMPAGQAEVDIPVTLIRHPDLPKARRSFKIRLIETPELKFIYTRSLPEYDEEGEVVNRPMDFQRVIRMDESFPIPSWWIHRGQPFFGDWSQTKAILICDVMNIDRERWMAPEALQRGYLKFCGQYMYKYLQENPHYEDDGTLMELGPESEM